MPPQARVETRAKITKYPTNSSESGMVLRMSEGNVRGEANREVGSVMERSTIGGMKIAVDGDRFTRKAKVNSDADACPNSAKN